MIHRLALSLSGDATNDKVLNGVNYYSTNPKLKQTGTMVSKGALTSSLNCGGVYNIATGYYSGGKITANSLAPQTPATATAAQILSGRTAWVNGSKLMGTVANRGAVSQMLPINGSYTIPAGFHNGSGKVTQSVATQGGSTTTPGTGNKTIVPANRYVTGNIVVAGDANLKAANIKKNTTIFGVKGTFQGYVDSPYYIYNQGTWAGLQTNGITNTKSEGEAFIDTYNNRLYLTGIRTACPFVAARLNSTFNIKYPVKFV